MVWYPTEFSKLKLIGQLVRRRSSTDQSSCDVMIELDEDDKEDSVYSLKDDALIYGSFKA